jgi:hypothetical protein
MGLMTGAQILAGARVFVFSRTAQPGSGSTPPVQWVLELFPRHKSAGV